MITDASVRDMVAAPLVFILAKAPEAAGVGAAFGALYAARVWHLGLVLGAVAIVAAGAGAFAAVSSLPRRPRPLAHVAYELADRVADWAGWEYEEITADSRHGKGEPR